VTVQLFACTHIARKKQIEFRLTMGNIRVFRPYIIVKYVHKSTKHNCTLNRPHARSTQSTHLHGSHIRSIGVYIPKIKNEQHISIDLTTTSLQIYIHTPTSTL